MRQKGHGQKLLRKKEQAICALLTCSTVQKAAAQIGVVPRTLQKWLSEPEFKQAFRDARREVAQGAMTRLQASMTEAADLLMKIARDREAAAGARVSACRCVLEMGIRAGEVAELEERLETLEALISAEKGRENRWN